jgi:Domain of unknown function (DUF4340)
MKKRLLTLLSSLFLLCVIYYAQFYNCRFFLPKGFLNIDPSEIASLTIFFKEQPYGFVKENSKWKLAIPYEKDMEQRSVEVFLKDLCMLSVTQKISGNPGESEMFGLKRPEIRINVTYGSEKRKMSVLLGNENEAKTSTYAKIGESNEIVLLGRIVKEDVNYIINMVDS